MKGKKVSKKGDKVKIFFKKLAAKLDKKMEEKAKSGKCGCSGDSGGGSCCS